jgi:hypothetical protein
MDRDEKSIVNYPYVDPIWDIDTFPLTYTDSRWFAFFYRADEKDLKRVLPPHLVLEDDVVEFWYVEHWHTMLGPYYEFGITVAASTEFNGKKYYAGYYPYMYLTSDAGVDAGRALGFPKKMAYIKTLEHGGKYDDGKELKGNDYFTFLISRNGYLMHTAQGKYDDAPLPAKPAFYGDVRYGRFNLRIDSPVTLAYSKWLVTYIASDYPPGSGKHRFAVKPETIRTCSAKNINWFMQSTPYDNFGGTLPVKEMIGLMSFTFDLIIPPAEVLQEDTYTRDASWTPWATEYKYGMAQRFPRWVGHQA